VHFRHLRDRDKQPYPHSHARSIVEVIGSAGVATNQGRHGRIHDVVQCVMNNKRIAVLAGVTALGPAGIGIGVGFAASGSSPAPTEVAGPSTSTSRSNASSYDYYHSMMDSYSGSSMMGGSFGWMMGNSGYQWMTGGTSAPAWMRGESLPGSMMGTDTDSGQVMGEFWANAPGPRVRPDEATQLGNQTSAGATIDTVARRITFANNYVHLVVLASPSMPAENFRTNGMVNPTIVVPPGAKVTIELINADSDMAHGLVVTADGASSSPTPMMSTPPAFSGAALWFLGESTSAGMREGTLSFTAGQAGIYQYLCPVPGHAQDGMVGTFVVQPSP